MFWHSILLLCLSGLCLAVLEPYTCEKASSLSFCSMVDWNVPVNSASSPSQMDTVAQEVFAVAETSYLLSGSSECHSAFKTSICMATFPKCTSDGLRLPCSSFCTSAQSLCERQMTVDCDDSRVWDSNLWSPLDILLPQDRCFSAASSLSGVFGGDMIVFLGVLIATMLVVA